MKVLLMTSLGALLLTGCDNFQLLKPLDSKNIQTFKPETITPPANNLPPQAGDPTPNQSPAIETQTTAANANSASPFPPVAAAPAAPQQTPAPAPVVAQQEPDVKPPGAVSSQIGQTPEAVEAKAAPVDSAKTAAGGSSEDKKETPATLAPVAPAAQTQTTAAPNAITVVEFMNLQAVLNKTFGEEIAKVVGKSVFPSDADRKEFKTNLKGTIEKFSLGIAIKDQTITEFNDIEILANGLNHFVNKDHEMVAVCSGAKCDILFIAITKFGENKKILENYPLTLKLVNNEYVYATFKTQAEYTADRSALPDQNNIKLVPQLLVSQKLSEHLDAHGGQFLDIIKKKLGDDETTAYSDLVIGQPDMRTNKFNPVFYRDNGKLMVKAKLEFTSPKNPLDFKVEINNEKSSGPSNTNSGLSMIVIPRVKDQIYAVVMGQNPYKSKITQVNKAFQALACSVMEEEKNLFSDCVTVAASLVFGEEGVIEGNTKQKIKETKQEATK